MSSASRETGHPAKSNAAEQIKQDAAKHAQEAAETAWEKQETADEAAKVAQEKQKSADEAAKVAREAATPLSRVGRAEAIVRRNVLWSLGAGAVPVPILDLVALTGVQIKMLKELSELYEVKFTEGTAKKILGSLVSSLGGVALGTAAAASVGKLIPVVGSAIGLALVPVTTAAFTYATGRVFLMHFESGGTFLDFDPDKLRAHFRQEFEKAKATVSHIRTEEQPKVTAL